MGIQTWHKKGANNTGAKPGQPKKTTVDKRIVARKVIDALNERIAKDKNLSDVSTDKLLTFLQSVMPKEHKVEKDTTVNYITQVARPVIEARLADDAQLIEDATVIEPEPDDAA